MVEDLEEVPDGGAEGFLFEAAAEAVDGDDASAVDAWGVVGGVLVFWGEGFVFGVVHDEPGFGFFDFAVGDEGHADGEGFLHEGHAEPAEGELLVRGGCGGGGAGGFEDGVASEAEEACALDEEVVADGGGGGLEVGEGEVAAVFVADGEVILQEVCDGVDVFAFEHGLCGGWDGVDVAQGCGGWDGWGLRHGGKGGRVCG